MSRPLTTADEYGSWTGMHFQEGAICARSTDNARELSMSHKVTTTAENGSWTAKHFQKGAICPPWTDARRSHDDVIHAIQ